MSSLTLITGLPGNGKTLFAVAMMVRLRDEGRQVLAMNFDGLDPSIAPTWPGPIENWKELPEGTVLFIDEAQDYVETKGKGGSPEWVKDFSKVRHGGLEIVFVTQDPRFLDPWVRRLVNKHINIVRTKGLQMAATHEWDRVKDDPVEYHAIEASTKGVFRYPKELYAAYKSANIHTVKKSIPKRLYLYLLLVPLFGAAIWYTIHTMGHFADGSKATTAAMPTSLHGEKLIAGSAAEYAMKFKPLVSTQPWSAPAYADLKATDFPVPSCIQTSEKCLCLSQQGTRYQLDDYSCRLVVKNGVFNPFDSARKDKQRGEDRREGRAFPAREKETTTVAAEGVGEEAHASPTPRGAGGSNPEQVPPGAGTIGYGPSALKGARK